MSANNFVRHRATARLAILACLCLLLMLLLQSCDPLGVKAIKEAVQILGDESANWQQTLKALSDKVMREGKAALANEVTQLMQRGVGTVGVEMRCNTDFIRNRMRQELERIVARLQGNPQPALEPTMCQVSPTGFDMGHRPLQVLFYGYDLDVPERGGVQAFLRHDGGEESLARWYNRVTHYLVAVSVAETSDVPLCNKEHRRIVLRWGNDEVSSVAVEKKECPPAPEPLPARTHYQVEDWVWSVGGPREDRDYGGDCKAGYVRQQCQVVKIDGGGHCEMKEWTSDDPHKCGCRVHFGAPPMQGVKCQIKITEVGEPQPRPPCPCW